jgi:hypothetical protein
MVPSKGHHNLYVKHIFRKVYERFPLFEWCICGTSFFSFLFFLMCYVPFYRMLIVNFRDKILCDLWAWCTIHGATTKGNIWALHWLCWRTPFMRWKCQFGASCLISTSPRLCKRTGLHFWPVELDVLFFVIVFTFFFEDSVSMLV